MTQSKAYDLQITPAQTPCNQLDFEGLDLDPIKVKLTDPKHGKVWTHAKVEKVALE